MVWQERASCIVMVTRYDYTVLPTTLNRDISLVYYRDIDCLSTDIYSYHPISFHPQDVRLHPRDVRAVLAGRQGQGGGVQRRGRHRRERGAARQLHDQDHSVTKGERARSRGAPCKILLELINE